MNIFKELFEGFFAEKLTTDAALSKKIFTAVNATGSSVHAGKLKNGAFFCEIISRREMSSDKLEELSKRLESLTFREFEPPEITRAGKYFRAVFCEKAPLSLETGAFELPLGALMNGDTNVCFKDGFGNDYVLISDGMGSGIRAAIESRMTVSLLQKFIRAGVSPDAAADFVNFLLQAKSDEEMLSTVDLLIFSRFSGEATLFKMGAAKTFVRIGGTIREYAGESLPAGILNDPGVDKIKLNLSEGDALLMLTDGITEENSGKCREILGTKAINPKTAARRVVEESENEGRQDDKTAIFVEVKTEKSVIST
jgi:stage II sporulation protein E